MSETEPERPCAIRASAVRKSFGDVLVLKGADFVARDGEVTCIIGPSGSGKSTLLRCLNHIETVDSGEIWFKGDLVGYHRRDGRLHEAGEREIARMRSRMGMVFQSFNLFGHMTALENVAAGPILVKRQAREAARRLALDHLGRVGLADKASSYPQQLSGGQQQRVAIARALAMEPELLLLDEPTSALDPDLVEEVLVAIERLAAAGTTMVVVTHELALVKEIADSVAFMSEGLVIEQGGVEQMFGQARSPLIRGFVGRAAARATQ